MVLNIILYISFVTCLVILVIRIAERFPNALDVDITDPLSVLDEEEPVSDICVVCARKKGSEPLLTCSDEKCINNSDTH
jgi:hypothetical protein